MTLVRLVIICFKECEKYLFVNSICGFFLYPQATTFIDVSKKIASVGFNDISYFQAIYELYLSEGLEAVVQRYSGKKVFLERCSQSLFFNKAAGLRLRHRCFPVNFVKFLRTPFLTEHVRWLLLKFYIKYQLELVWIQAEKSLQKYSLH